MVMGGVQIGKESEFPFGTNRRCWYLVVYTKDNTLCWETIRGNDKIYLKTIGSLCRVLIETDSNKRKALLFGVWHGKWNTNLFLLDPKKTLEILENRGVICDEEEALEYWRRILGIN